MPAIHDQFHGASTASTQPGRGSVGDLTRDLDLDEDAELQRRQIASHLLRAIEIQRLPEALAIRNLVFSGEPISMADRDSLTEMVQDFDRVSGLLDEEQNLGGARRGIAELREEILERARSNESARS